MTPSQPTCRKKRICYFGGSFDPPTYGHMFAAAAVAACHAVDEVWICPCGGGRHLVSTSTASLERKPTEKNKSALTARDAAAAQQDPACTAFSLASPIAAASSSADAAASHVTAAADAIPAPSSTITTSGLPATALQQRLLEEPQRMQQKQQQRQSQLSLQRALGRPDKRLASDAHARLAMTELAVNHFFGEGAASRAIPIKVVEWEALQANYTPTLLALQHFAAATEKEAANPAELEFHILIGEDVVPTLPRWYEGEKLMQRYSFLILPRSAFYHHKPLQLLKQRQKMDIRCFLKDKEPAASIEFAATTEAPAAVREAPAEAAKAMETWLCEQVGKVLRQLPRYAYVEDLCKKKSILYMPWPCSSSYARSVIQRRQQQPAAVRWESSTLVCPPVFDYIQQHGLYLP